MMARDILSDRILIRVTPDLKAAVECLSLEMGVRASAVARIALAEYIKKRGNKK